MKPLSFEKVYSKYIYEASINDIYEEVLVIWENSNVV